MVDKKFRKALDEFIEDHGIDEEVLILDNHAYDKSIIGLSEDHRLIYDYEKMIQEFQRDEKCSAIEAIEWLEFNTIPALAYMGERAPIIMADSKKSLFDRYG